MSAERARDGEREPTLRGVNGGGASSPVPGAPGATRDRSGVRTRDRSRRPEAPATERIELPGAAARPADRPLAGLGYMLLASASFAVMNALTGYLGRAGLPWQASGFARALLGLGVSVAFARSRGLSLRVERKRTMWSRSLAGSAGMLCTFYSLTHLPLADATTLLNTTPLWIALLAYVTVREKTSRSVLAALVIAAAGIVLIERPSLAAGSGAGLVALSAGVASALAMVSLRRLSGETPEAVVVHFSAVATGVMAALVGWSVWQSGLPHALGAAQWVMLGCVGLVGTAGQLSLTRAYALDRAARVGAAGWMQIVFALLIDTVLFGHVPAWTTLGGIGLIVSAGALLVRDAVADEGRIRSR